MNPYDPPVNDFHDAGRTRRFPAWPIFGLEIGSILIALAVLFVIRIVYPGVDAYWPAVDRTVMTILATLFGLIGVPTALISMISLFRRRNQMQRFVVFLILALAILWMVIPMISTLTTLMGFLQGTPDPNTHTTYYVFGFPLPWLVYSTDWTELGGYSHAGIMDFSIFNCLLHLVTILVVLVAALQAGKSKHSVNANS